MKQINILFFGLGSIGQRHIRNILKLRIKNVNLFAYRFKKQNILLNEKNKKIKGKISVKYKIKEVNNLNDYKFDIVFITNPSSLHCKSILRLSKQKNLYIFIEKPIDTKLYNIRKVLSLSKKNKFNLFVACNLRFNDGFQILNNLIKKNTLGKINYTVVKSGLNIRDFHTYEDYRKSYTSIKRLGGGINFTSVHEIDLIKNIFDKTKILKSITDKISNLKVNVPDFSTSIFENYYKTNKLYTIMMLDHFQINEERYVKIIAQKGEIFWDLIKNKIKISGKKTKLLNLNKNKNSMYMNQIKYFFKLYKNKKPVPSKYNEKNGIECLKLALKMNLNK